MKAQPFQIKVKMPVLADLKNRLARTRWPDEGEPGWESGADLTYTKELIEYWQRSYRWEKQQAKINELPHYQTRIGGLTIHYVHARGKGPDPLPIVLTHGWPDSFLRFKKLIPMLADPVAYGAGPEDAFDVVVPSIPGFGFSERPTKKGATFQIHNLWATLMTGTLGYKRFGAHGGDWGSVITEQLGRSHAESVLGIHLTDVPFIHAFQKPDDLTSAEKKYFEDNQRWQKEEGAYAMIQGTRPHTLAAGLSDSPAGLAAWIIEKFQSMNDAGGNLDKAFGKDELLDNIMIYWITESVASSFLPYYDILNAGPTTWIAEKVKEWAGSTNVPAAFAWFPRENSHPPREWAERFFNVQRWTKLKHGGHFGVMEAPELLAEDIRTFFRSLRRKTPESFRSGGLARRI